MRETLIAEYHGALAADEGLMVRLSNSPVVNVTSGGVRLSVGLEDWHDIIEDLRAAFESI
jgi:cystathionine beta-lyase/cystathionine gamma-synthase